MSHARPIPDVQALDPPDDDLDDLHEEEEPYATAAAASAGAFERDGGFEHDDAQDDEFPEDEAYMKDDVEDHCIADDQDEAGDGYVQDEEVGQGSNAHAQEERDGIGQGDEDAPAAEEDEEEEGEEATDARGRDNEHLMYRRRRDVRAARDRLGEQFEQLRRVLPDPPSGVELNAKAQVLEHSLDVIQSLMKRATELAMELAVVSPEATRRWVRMAADDGRKPLMHSVSRIMKLFAARKDWRYAEWWTLDEKRNVNEEDDEKEGGANDGDTVEHEMPVGVTDDPSNVHGCVVRDPVSVMRLGWTLIQRSAANVLSASTEERKEEEDLARFARASSGFEFKPQIGMPGRVWTSRRAEWLIDLGDKEIFLRSPLAKQFGMKTCLAVPIQFGGHVHSVMAFYSREVRGYNPDCYDLACLLSQCLEEVYSPSNAGPWQISDENLFPSAPMR